MLFYSSGFRGYLVDLWLRAQRARHHWSYMDLRTHTCDDRWYARATCVPKHACAHSSFRQCVCSVQRSYCRQYPTHLNARRVFQLRRFLLYASWGYSFSLLVLRRGHCAYDVRSRTKNARQVHGRQRQLRWLGLVDFTVFQRTTTARTCPWTQPLQPTVTTMTPVPKTTRIT